MTVVTVNFPDERIKSKHMHTQFRDHEDAVLWVRDVLDRFGSGIRVDYQDMQGPWQCPACKWQVHGYVPKAKAAIGRFGITDLE